MPSPASSRPHTAPHPRIHAPLSRRSLLLGGAGALGLAACSGGGPSDSLDATGRVGGPLLNLYGYSVGKPAFEAALTSWRRTPAGADATTRSSYGPSGEQSRKVLAGAPADVVGFSIEPDITRLVAAGLVSRDWDGGPHHAIPFGSVVVLVMRKGNPLQITGWEDLLRPGTSVVTPNPLSSGSAQWNLLAPYAAHSAGGEHPASGLAYLAELVGGHVHQQPTSGSEATEVFRQGAGDVLLSYENEAIAAIRRGEPFEYLVPAQTIRIDNPVAVLARSPRAELASDFVAHLSSPAAQHAVAAAGYRVPDPTVAAAHATDFPPPAEKLWTITDLGGWPAVTRQLFDARSGSITRIYTGGRR